MALYEYRCKSCDASRTISRGITEKEVTPHCDSCNLSLSRVYSSVGVTFNGGGFYSTDNKGR
jgi:putative FmdB family regulatory protein